MTSKAEILIAALLDKPETFADHYDLLTEYFHGYPVATLKRLIAHPHRRVCGCAVWIASELAASALDVLPDIASIIMGAEDRVRSDAFDVILLNAKGKYVRYFSSLVNGLLDSNCFIRSQVMFLLSNAENQQLEYVLQNPNGLAEKTKSHVDGLQLLGGERPSVQAIMAKLTSNDELIRRYAAIASRRHYPDERSLIECLKESDDAEIRGFINYAGIE